jgi:hypothetical protein
MRCCFVFSVTVVFGSVVGCGGSSTSFSDETGGHAGSGASSSAGSGAGEPGSGGNVGSGGSGNSGVGGSVAGAGAQSGAGGMRGYHPPERQVEGCTELCQREAEAMCENEDSLDDCIGDCRVAILFEDCSADWDAVFECAKDAEVSCDDAGKATFSSCLEPYASAVACVFGDGLDTSFEAPCSSFCAASSVPDCENGDSQADCVGGCVLIASAFPVCNDLLTAQLDCGSTAEWSCSEAGEPEALACFGETLSLLSCIVNEYDLEP